MSQVPMIAPLENTLIVRSSLLIKCLKCLGSLLEGVWLVGMWVGRFFGHVMSPHDIVQNKM